MLFNSIEFAIFLPIVFLLYWFIFQKNLKLQNLFNVVVSYIFYGWWDWRFLFLIAFTSACSFGAGLLIDKYRDTPGKAKAVNVVNIVLNLLILGVFKYYDFFVTSFADAFLGGKTDGLLLKVILPVGISFYTFQALSYSIDVYRGKLEPTRDIVQFFAFVSFFPQLVAGPIERATNLLPQFGAARTFKYDEGVDGLRQILWGLFKKMVVADNCAEYVDQVFAGYTHYTGSTLLLAALLFTFQIYCDFSGYSDIAIGTAKLFGIRLMRNFDTPYFSRSVTEFWRRWHISLTTWFRDYVYIPLGGSRTTRAKVVRNILVVFLLSGLWHGANWTFIVWGAYHGLLLCLEKSLKRKSVSPLTSNLLPLTFFLVLLGWIVFRSASLADAWGYLGGLFSSSLFSVPFLFVGTKKTLLMVAVMLVLEWFTRSKEHALQFDKTTKPWLAWVFSLAVVLMILEFSTVSQSFIYFQF